MAHWTSSALGIYLAVMRQLLTQVQTLRYPRGLQTGGQPSTSLPLCHSWQARVRVSTSAIFGRFVRLVGKRYMMPRGPQLRKKANVLFSEDLRELHCNGILLNSIHGLGGLDQQELRCQSFICSGTGHTLLQSEGPQHRAPRASMQPMDWLEAIARSLVIDRQDKYLCFQAPVHYITDFLFLCHACVDGDPVDWTFSTWFEHNRHLRFGEDTLEQLIVQVPSEVSSPPPTLHRPSSHPMHQMSDKLDTFLSRFHDTVRKKTRRLMVTEDGVVGMAPCRAKPGDVVAILYGCSIPLVLRQGSSEGRWKVIGEAYVHGHMNGEAVTLIKRGKSHTQRLLLE